MKKIQKIFAAILLLLILAAAYLFWISREPESVRKARAAARANRASKSLVDQTPLKIAQQLAPLATTNHERELAKEALRLADYEVDLAFDAGLHEALQNPPPLTPEAKAIQDRIKKAEKLLTADQEHAKLLSEALVKAPPTRQDALQEQLVQAQADMELDQDELDDAKGDFARAGGNLADRIQALKQEHEETRMVRNPCFPPGLLRRHRSDCFTGSSSCLRCIPKSGRFRMPRTRRISLRLPCKPSTMRWKPWLGRSNRNRRISRAMPCAAWMPRREVTPPLRSEPPKKRLPC